MNVFTTERLALRRLTEDDAGFILALVNEAEWLRYVGDKNVHDLEQARRYLRQGPIASYEQSGFGLYMVELLATSEPLGICGLLKRPSLEHADVGFAIAAKHRGHGYATEAARASLEHGRREFGLRRIVAITSPDNEASCRVLEKIGFRFEEQRTLDDGHGPVRLFAWEEPSP